MTQRQTSRSRVLKRAGVALAAAIAVSTVASTASAANRPQASKYGGTAKVAIFDTFAGWCFADNNANSSLMAVRTVYETLFEKTIGGDMVGLLAEKAVPSGDLKQWTIYLRKGIKFHDNTDLTATAVKTNLDYAAGFNSAALAAAGAAKKGSLATAAYTALSASTTTKALLQAIGITDFSASKATSNVQTVAFMMAVGAFAEGGALDKASGGLLKSAGLTTNPDADWYASTYQLSTASAFIGALKKVTADDAAGTVTIDLNRAVNDLPNVLYASGRFFIRGTAQFTNGGTRCSGGRPIGTGPFMTAENYTLSATDSLSVVKNKNYWRTDPATGDKLPYLDGINFVDVKEGSTRAAAVRKGTYDAGMFASSTEARFIQDLRKRKSILTEFKSPVEYYPSLWLNQSRAGSPFSSKNARLAVLHCLDRANFVKSRTRGENTIAKSLVGPKSVMYTPRGFQAFSTAKSAEYLAAWKAENPTKNVTLEFTFPSDIATSSVANAKFFQDQWAKCGIKANIDIKEAAQIIRTALNSSKTTAAEQNGYDAIFILLLEGTDVSFNLPFVVQNMIPNDPLLPNFPWRGTVGSVLSLNHPLTNAVDTIMFAGEAAPNAATAKIKYMEGTALLQTEGYMSSVSHQYYTFFVNKAKGLKNIGKVQLIKGKTQRIVTNWGIDWSGVQKG